MQLRDLHFFAHPYPSPILQCKHEGKPEMQPETMHKRGIQHLGNDAQAQITLELEWQ